MQHCAGFISAGSLYMFWASSAHHLEYLKLVQRPLVLVSSLQVSHLIRAGTECVWEGDSAEIKPAQCCIKLVFYLTSPWSHPASFTMITYVRYVRYLK